MLRRLGQRALLLISLYIKRNEMAVGDFEMSQKQFVISNDQMAAIIVDVLGIVLVLVGSLIVHAHSNSGVGLALYWLGFVLLIVALIIFVLGMRKVNVTKN